MGAREEEEEKYVTRGASAFVVELVDCFARATILAGRRAAWHVLALAILPGVSSIAVAPAFHGEKEQFIISERDSIDDGVT